MAVTYNTNMTTVSKSITVGQYRILKVCAVIFEVKKILRK